MSVAVAGCAFAWLEPLTLRMGEYEVEGLHVGPEMMSWLVSIVEVGCLIAPPAAGWLANRYGRKMVILSTGPICLLAWLLILLTRSLEVLFLVRILQGLATGIVFTVTPIYTAEIAEPRIRGRVSGIFQVTWYSGVLYSFLVGPYLSYDMYALACVPLPLVFTLLFMIFPESPYSLLMRGRPEEAKRILSWLRSSNDVNDEFVKMQEAVEEEMGRRSSWRTLFCDKNERKAFIILQIVSVTKFLTGMPTIVNYASETFSISDGMLSASEMTIILGAMLSGIAVLSAFLSDWVGRRLLLLTSAFGCFVSHALTGAYYFLQEKTAVDAQPYVWLMYVGLSGYCFFSDIGLGPLMQTLQAEMFGANTRGLAAGITELFAAILSFSVLKAYRPINDEFGVYFNFWMYGAVGLIGGILLWILMFETAGKTIGRMEEPATTTEETKT